MGNDAKESFKQYVGFVSHPCELLLNTPWVGHWISIEKGQVCKTTLCCMSVPKETYRAPSESRSPQFNRGKLVCLSYFVICFFKEFWLVASTVAGLFFGHCSEAQDGASFHHNSKWFSGVHVAKWRTSSRCWPMHLRWLQIIPGQDMPSLHPRRSPQAHKTR